MFNETAAKPWQPSQPPGKGQEGRSGVFTWLVELMVGHQLLGFPTS